MPTPLRRVIRSWIWIERARRRTVVRVDTIHPEHGVLQRGTLEAVDVADTPGPGIAGTLVWHGRDPDHLDLGRFTGNYLDAERWLLDASPGLD